MERVCHLLVTHPFLMVIKIKKEDRMHLFIASVFFFFLLILLFAIPPMPFPRLRCSLA